MRTYNNNLLTVSNTKSLNHNCGSLTFETLNLHHEKFTLEEKIVSQGLIYVALSLGALRYLMKVYVDQF